MKKIIFYLTVVSITLSGCRDWLDINYDPNNTTRDNVTIGLFLPQTQVRTASLLHNSSNQYFLSHHLTKSGGVGGTFNFLTGLIQAQDSNGFWEALYTINANLVIVREKAVELETKSYEGIAQVLLVHNFHRLVDMFGDIPYTEALQKAELYMPAYDRAQDVYAGLLSDIDQAIANLNAAKSSDQVVLSNSLALSTNDVMCKGDMDKWIRFANSLKLRMLMRVSGVQNVSSQIAALVNSCLGPNEMMTCNPGFRKESGKLSPFYSNFGWTYVDAENSAHIFYLPTRDLVEMLNDNNDPRLRAYIQPRQNIGDVPADQGQANYTKWGIENEYYIGNPFGQQNPPLNPYTSYISIGIMGLSADPNVACVSDSPVMGGFEVQFYLAEAALTGIIPGGDAAAKAYYEAGVKGVFNYLSVPLRANYAFPNYLSGYIGVKPPISGTPDEAAQEYLSQDNAFCNWDLMANADAKLNAIACQKWISLFGVNPIEAWCEHRRLDLPELGRSMQFQTNSNFSILHYPQTENNLNTANVNAAGSLERNPNTTLLFWDKANPTVPMVQDYL